MCAFIQRSISEATLQQCLAEMGWSALQNEDPQDQPALVSGQWQFYPAFGGQAQRQIKGLVCAKRLLGDGDQTVWHPQAVNATWWFDCQSQGHTLRVGSRTTFNARNLQSPFWRSAVAGQRALVLATGVGETHVVNGRKIHYLMVAEQPFFLGALYQQHRNGLFSCAVITKQPTPGFAQFHEKAAPLILPADSDLLNQWLDPQVNAFDNPSLARLMMEPSLPISLAVTPVKTFKAGLALGETTVLPPE